MYWTNEIYSKHLSTPKIQAALFIYWPMWRYTSKSSSSAEKNYSQMEREALVIMFGVKTNMIAFMLILIKQNEKYKAKTKLRTFFFILD